MRSVPALVALPLALAACAEAPAPGGRRAAAPPARPPGLHPFTWVGGAPELSQVAGAHLLLTQFDDAESFAVVIDGRGGHRWWEGAEPGERITRARLARDGATILIGEYDLERVEDLGSIERVDPALGRVTSTRAEEHHHDFVELPEGGFAWLAWEYLENDLAPELGGILGSDVVRTAPEGSTGGSEVLFSVAGITGYDPWWTCNHMRRGDFKPGVLEWTHSNSLVLDDASDTFTVLVRHWDAVLRVDRAGGLRWVLGGPHGDLLVTRGTLLPAHGHLSEAPPGRLLVFDNANHTDRPSRAVELEVDEAAGTVRQTWSWELPGGARSSFLGDVRELADGHRLVAVAAEGRILELDRDDRVVWEVDTDQQVGRVEVLRAWTW